MLSCGTVGHTFQFRGAVTPGVQMVLSGFCTHALSAGVGSEHCNVMDLYLESLVAIVSFKSIEAIHFYHI
jgi:hypothetical protein